MSISYCDTCERIVEGRTHTCENAFVDKKTEFCDFCGEQVIEVPEDDPKEDR